MAYVVYGVYVVAMLGILGYCLLQLTLAYHYLRAPKKTNLPPTTLDNPNLPTVTVQLPIYNEQYVIERLIKAVAAFEYPREKLEVQVLDDSTDETTDILRKLLPRYRDKGLEIKLLHREDRTGFKAGALQEGLKSASGDYIAIFDADFIPNSDFLLKTVPYFQDDSVAVVQTRWEHLNYNYSLLTRIQAFTLDVHFTVEQRGRNSTGLFINFNGTAGIWNKNAILDAGGWSADTLTEDLDLSYRAQLKGWKFVYLEEVGSPSELPAEIKGYKSQQFRWNKGGAETAKKIIPKILRSDVPWRVKVHGLSHLLNSSVYVCILLTILLSVPLLWFLNKQLDPRFIEFLSIFFVASLATAIVFFVALYASARNKWAAVPYYLLLFPIFIAWNLGLSLHNALAVLKGWVGKRTPFERTPKFNIVQRKDSWKRGRYLTRKIDGTVWLEGMMILYFAAAIYLAFHIDNYTMVPIHILAFLGFLALFGLSIRQWLIR